MTRSKKKDGNLCVERGKTTHKKSKYNTYLMCCTYFTTNIIVEKDVKFDDQNAWPQQFEYIMDVCMKMKKAFRKYI